MFIDKITNKIYNSGTLVNIIFELEGRNIECEGCCQIRLILNTNKQSGVSRHDYYLL